MAVDSAIKRFAILNARSPIRRPLFIPDGTVEAIDRAHLLNRYGGIPFDLPVAPPPPSVELPREGRDGGALGGYQRIRNRKKLRAIIKEDEEIMTMASKALSEILAKILH